MKQPVSILIGIVFFFVVVSVNGAENSSPPGVEELEKKLTQLSGKDKIDVLNRLSYLTHEQSPGKCIEYCRQALELADSFNYPAGEGTALQHLGMTYRVLKESEKALEYTQRAIMIYEKLGDKKKIANALNSMGVIYLYNAQYDRSIDNFLKALDIGEEIDDKKEIKDSLNNIGVVYFWQNDSSKALDYYQRSLQIERESGSQNGIAASLNNIALVHHQAGNYKEALHYYNESLKIDEAASNNPAIANTWMNLGIIEANMGNYKKSEEYLNKSLALAESLGLKLQIIQILSNLGELYFQDKQYDKALKYSEKVLEISGEMKTTETIKNTYLTLSTLYESKGNYKKALEYYRLFFEAYKAMFNEESTRQMNEMQTRYETLKTNKKIEILEKDNQIQKVQLGREKFTRNAFITGFIMVVIILLLLFKKYLYLLAFWKKQKYIGEFRLMDIIGSGGMGVIYKAHHIKNKAEFYAVKVLREELSENQDIVKRFKQEASIIDNLEHDNIVKIIERGQYKQKFFIAMEFLEGKTLETVLTEDGWLSLPDSLHIMTQIADALAFIHSKNVIHRDLKPSNIILTNHKSSGNVVKLLDFGVARLKFQMKLTRTGVLLGTTPYLSPEQITSSDVSTASDIFSLGIIYYEMLCGRKPFGGESENDIIKEILGSRPVEPQLLRAEIPRALSSLVMRMLEKKMGSRPTSSEILSTLKEIFSNQFPPADNSDD